MKWWGLIVAFLYVLILAVIFFPEILIRTAGPATSFQPWQQILLSFSVCRSVFDPRSVWSFLTIAFIAQAALLTVPVEIANKRPVTKRSIIPLILATSLMMMVLVYGLGLALMEIFHWDILYGWLGVGILGGVWIFWAVVFFLWSRKLEPMKLVERQCRWLFRGCILQFLIAVPSHVYARHSKDCCAGFPSAIGIMFGIAVMLFSFGPGVFFLYQERIAKITKAQPPV